MTTWIRIALAVSFAASLSAQLPEPPNYVIGPEDVLTVTVFNEPSLSGRFRVENDGHFNYPFLGRVRAGGVTLSDVAATLKTKLADGYLRNPQVTVDVDQFRSQSVFVMGEVRSPGKYVLSGTVSLLEVLAQAGSTTALAGPEIVVLHPKTPVAGAVSLCRARGLRSAARQHARDRKRPDVEERADPRRRHHLRAQGRALLRGRAGAQPGLVRARAQHDACCRRSRWRAASPSAAPTAGCGSPASSTASARKSTSRPPTWCSLATPSLFVNACCEAAVPESDRTVRGRGSGALRAAGRLARALSGLAAERGGGIGGALGRSRACAGRDGDGRAISRAAGPGGGMGGGGVDLGSRAAGCGSA